MIAVILVGLLALLAWAYSHSQNKDFPPGPMGFPILGHLPLLGRKGHTVMMKWSEMYGPVVGIRLGSYRAVAIHDPKLIRDALSTSAFSGRPMLNLFTAKGNGVLKGILINEGKSWEEQRRFVHKNLKDFRLGTKSMEVQILHEAVQLLKRLHLTAGKPIPAKESFSGAVLNVIWNCMFSEGLNLNDPTVAEIVRILTGFADDKNMLAGLSIFIPWIATYLPKFSGYEELTNRYPYAHEFIMNRIAAHRKNYIPGQPRDLVDSYMDQTMATTDENSSFHPKHNEMPFIIADLLSAGIETTTTSLTSMCAYLIHNPKVQRKLQDEIDQVVGKDRLPCLADRVKMHYTEAVINEVLRYSSVVPQGIFHNINEDTHFEGYLLPKDTMVIPNLYSCHFDVKLWGDPENFRPERFLDVNGTFRRNDNLMAFSVGKRACLGETLARDELFLFTTFLFQKFTIQSHGELPSLEPIIGITASLPPFEMILKER